MSKTMTLSQDATVLLIDDDEFVAGPLRHYLAIQGCAVTVAHERAAAEDFMKTASYGVVVVDPYLTGAVHDGEGSLIRSIRRLQPHAAVIVLTGYASPQLGSV